MSHSDLSQNQKKALTALLTHPRVSDAARAAGLTRQTMHRYLNDPVFKQELRLRQANANSALTAVLVTVSSMAVVTLVDVMKDREASHSAKVAAARAILSATAQRLENETILERIEALEERLNEQKR